MSNLHHELLDQAKEWEDARDLGYQLGALPAVLRAVVELHAPDLAWGCCNHEGASVSWPCPTVQAIARELGVQEDDHHD